MKQPLTKSEIVPMWLAIQATNPPKATGILGVELDGKIRRCCLGNVCHVLATVDALFFEMEGIAEKYGEGGDNAKYSLPASVSDLLGITENAEFDLSKEIEIAYYLLDRFDISFKESLADLNDSTGLNHKQIGEIIGMAFANNWFLRVNP